MKRTTTSEGLPPLMLRVQWKTRAGDTREAFYFNNQNGAIADEPRTKIRPGLDMAAAMALYNKMARRISAASVATRIYTADVADQEMAKDAVSQTRLNRIKKSARLRGIPFELDRDDLVFLYQRAGGHCEVSGIRFSTVAVAGNHRVHPWLPSLDRIDSAGPYRRDNCRFVCFMANWAMNDFGLPLLIELSAGILRHNALQAAAWNRRAAPTGLPADGVSLQP